jgi:hypothetical protein
MLRMSGVVPPVHDITLRLVQEQFCYDFKNMKQSTSISIIFAMKMEAVYHSETYLATWQYMLCYETTQPLEAHAST